MDEQVRTCETCGAELEEGTAGCPACAQQRSERLRLRFRLVLGVAIGALSALLIVAIAGGVYVWMMLSAQRSYMSSGSSDTVTTYEAGGTWFDVAPDGTGELEGYWGGGGGSGGGEMDGEPKENVGYIEMQADGVQDGIRFVHTVKVFLDAKTQIYIAGKKWSPPDSGADSQAEALLGYDDDPMMGRDSLEERMLTITFKKVGDDLLATRIDASTERIDIWNRF